MFLTIVDVFCEGGDLAAFFPFSECTQKNALVSLNKQTNAACQWPELIMEERTALDKLTSRERCLTPWPVPQEMFLVTVKPAPNRIPVGTVVRIADGLDSCGPLRAGQTAITVADDGSVNPYRVRTLDGEDHGYWFPIDNLVPADEAASVRPSPDSVALTSLCKIAE